MGLSPLPVGLPGKLWKLPEPSSTLDHLNHNTWGWALGIDLEFESSSGDPDVQTGSRGIYYNAFSKDGRDRFSPLEKISPLEQKLTFSLETFGSLKTKGDRQHPFPGARAWLGGACVFQKAAREDG